MDEKIEAVARALCAFYGKDPDAKTPSLGGRVGFQSHVGETPMDGPPLWQSYKDEAEKFVLMSEALHPLLRRIERW